MAFLPTMKFRNKTIAGMLSGTYLKLSLETRIYHMATEEDNI